MEDGESGLVKEMILRASVAAEIRKYRPESRAAEQQELLAGRLLSRWVEMLGRDLSTKTGRASTRGN